VSVNTKKKIYGIRKEKVRSGAVTWHLLRNFVSIVRNKT
jgi:hypothetical protein